MLLLFFFRILLSVASSSFLVVFLCCHESCTVVLVSSIEVAIRSRSEVLAMGVACQQQPGVQGPRNTVKMCARKA